jgi:cytochrome c oxidase cbb3-type subunit IV
MSDYHWLRAFADSWGLVAMGVLWLAFIGWAFLPNNRAANRRAAGMIFEESDIPGDRDNG